MEPALATALSPALARSPEQLSASPHHKQQLCQLLMDSVTNLDNKHNKVALAQWPDYFGCGPNQVDIRLETVVHARVVLHSS
jgi:hypothetical protein